MRINKNYWLAACGTLAVAGAIMLFSAHRIEAQYTSPVKVLNTSAAPAIASVIDDQARVPYLSYQAVTPPANAGSLTFNFPAVPANHRLVVQHLTGWLFVAPGSPTFVSLGQPGFSPMSAFQTQPLGGGATSVFDQPVLGYFDAGQQPQVYAIDQSNFLQGTSTLTLTGYMIDCSAAPCAAIAH
jgi:hypothetical protein